MRTILGIETSCDDTSVGIVQDSGRTLRVIENVTASQILTHRKYGGVVPEVAAREHAITILPTISGALRQAKMSWKNIDAIAVTAGPGLQTALTVGVEAARTISWLHNIPLLRINHIEGHICSSWASPEAQRIRFPALALVVSGGHTELILVRGFGSYRGIGRTIDDAVGEAFDKTAKVLGLPYPGGPEVSRRAVHGNPKRFQFPRALMHANNLDFSYAGLKTSVLYKRQEFGRLSAKLTADMCASFQVAALEPLIEKSSAALKKTGAKTFLLGGGVAANPMLRQLLRSRITQDHPGVVYVEPELRLCTDNGAMIALAGALRLRKHDVSDWETISADPNWELI